MDLRIYQKNAITAALSSFSFNKRHLIVLPTGSGKTVVFMQIAKRSSLKTLVVAHTKEIISQASQRVSELKLVDIDVLSIQKASSTSFLKNLPSLGYELLIIDECHRSHANSYKKLIERFGDRHVLGVTATPFRTDKKTLSSIFGAPVFELHLLEMIDQGFLCDFTGYKISTSVSLNNVRKNRGDFSERNLSAVVNVANRNQLIVQEYKNLARTDKALCFCADVSHAVDLRNEFIAQGISCEAIHGKLPNTSRKNILSDFKSGKIQVLTNCQVLTEGFNEPSISCLIMARPTCSKVLYMQMIGRGSRVWPGKETCKVIEFTDNDFDVCHMEELLEKKIPNFRIKHGERLTTGFSRMKKELLEVGTHTFVEKKILIPKTIYERPASSWQINELKKLNISYEPSITEFLANTLIFGVSNGIHM